MTDAATGREPVDVDAVASASPTAVATAVRRLEERAVAAATTMTIRAASVMAAPTQMGDV